jgi:hypothetical protein
MQTVLDITLKQYLWHQLGVHDVQMHALFAKTWLFHYLILPHLDVILFQLLLID